MVKAVKTNKKKKKKFGWRGHVILVASVALAIVFLPTSFMLAIGMLPTGVAFIIDRSQGKLKALTVGAMNLAGCLPFIMELWVQGHTFPNALTYITQPRTIIVMYFSAAIGYMIEWAVVSIVRSIMVERGKARLQEIVKLQAELEQKWGPEVSGRLALDDYGFPLEDNESSKGETPKDVSI